MQKPSIPKGTRDFGPEQTRKRAYIISTIRKQFERYGFQPIETPSLENLSTLTGKYGDEGDQLLFKILNSGDFLSNVDQQYLEEGSKAIAPKIAEKGLRYDLTVPFARYVVMNQNDIAFPFKRYQIQPVWRADRPQRGRYREFYQCDADIIGTNSKWNEVELILLIHDVFNDLGIEDYILKINHREILFGFAEKLGLKGKEIPFTVSVDKLDKIGSEKVEQEIIELGADQELTIQFMDLLKEAPSNEEKLKQILNFLNEDNGGISDLNYIVQTINTFSNRNLKIEIDWSLARGLSYYTGLIYEVKPTSVKMGSILGGGRYDDLTGVFGLPDVSGIGISFGLDRIYDVMNELNLFPPDAKSGTKVLITSFDEASFNHGLILLESMRSSGISSEIYPEPVKIKKQISYANKREVPFVITVGDNEIQSRKYPLKDMKNGTQDSRSLEEIIEILS